MQPYSHQIRGAINAITRRHGSYDELIKKLTLAHQWRRYPHKHPHKVSEDELRQIKLDASNYRRLILMLEAAERAEHEIIEAIHKEGVDAVREAVLS